LSSAISGQNRWQLRGVRPLTRPVSGRVAEHGCARLFLVRHGQASLGTDDYDRLSERGHRQAARVAARLAGPVARGAGLWSGTLRRHNQTLAPLAHARAADVERSEDLNEFSTQGLMRVALEHSGRLGLAIPPRHQLADPAAHPA